MELGALSALAIVAGLLTAATPLLFAAIGELVVEKSGVLNLGVEGMMIAGAVAGFVASVETGNPWLGTLAAVAAGVALAALFAVLTQFLMSNQVATGLALTLFGLGLAALIGQPYAGTTAPNIRAIEVPGLSDAPVVGPLLFGHDPFVYFAVLLTGVTAWWLGRTRGGLILRAVGENHESAHAIGYGVAAIRCGAILFGGACAGLGGAYLALVQTPALGGGNDGGSGLDRAGDRRLRRVAALARASRRVPVRRGDHPAAEPAGAGRRRPERIPVDGPLSGHDTGAGDHLLGRRPGPAECARLPRKIVLPGNLNASGEPVQPSPASGAAGNTPDMTTNPGMRLKRSVQRRIAG